MLYLFAKEFKLKCIFTKRTNPPFFMPPKKQKVEPIAPQKKRGRKPKGGKIIFVTENEDKNNSYSTNVIVHLKCKNSDLVNEIEEAISLGASVAATSVQGVNGAAGGGVSNTTMGGIHSLVTGYSEENKDVYQSVQERKVEPKKNINDKLKALQINLHNNVVNETDSACFWCTYNFSNLPISIPKFEINRTYHVYGCFCSPECACAYLMNENIDSSIKFERYHLLCYIYTKVYEYKQNIKPAPNPHYTLNKFFGNLSIDDYRELHHTDKHLFIIDKPITRELPELHEEFCNHVKSNYSFQTVKT
jgi:hypothetical protein